MAIIDPIEEQRANLAIDPDDLDTGLVEHSELLFHASKEHADAIARRDSAKLDLEEEQARLGREIRQEALDAKEKLTEGALTERLTLEPNVKRLQRAYLKAKHDADRWFALKESFGQRSFMLTKLVEMYVARYSGSMDRTVQAHTGQIGDVNNSRLKAIRRKQRGHAD